MAPTMQSWLLLLVFSSSLLGADALKRAQRRLVHPEKMDVYGSVDCRTPSGSGGQCVILSECPTLSLLLERPTRAAWQLIRNSTCGFLGSASAGRMDTLVTWFSWVCCPAEVPPLPAPQPPPAVAAAGKLLRRSCGRTRVGRNRIVGGGRAPKGAWPWIAMLMYQTGASQQTEFYCSGALITDRHVLTASHCLRSLPNDTRLVAVRLGEHVVGEEEEGLQEIAVSRAVPHPHFSENPLNNDVAVVTLAKAARLDGYVQPICVLLEGAPDPERMIGEKMFVAGWGRTHENGNTSRYLKEARIPIVSLDDCVDAHREVLNANIDSTVVCTGLPNGGIGACQGDSGGPLMWPVGPDGRYHLMALVRSAVGCGRPGFPGMFTRVDPYIDWIVRNLH